MPRFSEWREIKTSRRDGTSYAGAARRSLTYTLDRSTARSPRLRTSMRRCILIVEPNDRGRESLQALLEVRGHEVHVAGTGAQALAKALIFHPDIVVVADYDLGDMPFQQAVFEL